MRDLVTFTVSLVAVLALCMPVECETGFLVRTRISEDPLDSEPVIKNKIIASSRFWGKRSLPDDLRRASLRWGKRWDPKVWKRSYSEMLHPVNIVSPGWSPIRTNDNSDDIAQETSIQYEKLKCKSKQEQKLTCAKGEYVVEEFINNLRRTPAWMHED